MNKPIVRSNAKSTACPFCFSEDIEFEHPIKPDGTSDTAFKMWKCNNCAQHKFEPLEE